MTRTLKIDHLSKRFAADVLAIDDVTFEVRDAEFFTMLGPSGCGKTTTLRIVAGLEQASAGTIDFAGQDFITVPAQQRNIGMVFQSYALFPHLSVFDNVAYGLQLRGMGSDDIRVRVGRMLDLLRLAPLAERLPAALSGGQQQRVSIARALVYEPSMLLLDEPLANLDAKLRVLMREEIRRIQRELGIMSLYVTHDQEEAMSVSDRLAVFNLGRLMQLGHPQAIYDAPTSLFVADFIGKANFLRGRVASHAGGAAQITLADGTRFSSSRLMKLTADENDRCGEGFDALVMLRPERLILTAAGTGTPCRVTRVQFLGGVIRYAATAECAAGDLTIDAPRPVDGIGEGSAGRLQFAPADAVVFLRDGA